MFQLNITIPISNVSGKLQSLQVISSFFCANRRQFFLIIYFSYILFLWVVSLNPAIKYFILSLSLYPNEYAFVALLAK